MRAEVDELQSRAAEMASRLESAAQECERKEGEVKTAAASHAAAHAASADELQACEAPDTCQYDSVVSMAVA